MDVENVSKLPPTSAIDAERAQLLASLPDPDAGKSDEERREIVSYYRCIHLEPCY